MLAGPYLWPTAAQRFFDEQSTSIRSARSRQSMTTVYVQLQRAYGKRIERYTEDDLVRFLNSKPWAGGTVGTYRSALVSIFSWATHVGLCQKDPSSYLKKLVRPNTRPVTEHHWLEAHEVAHILDSCGPDLQGRRDRAALALGFYSGLRRSEIAGLTWDKVRANHLLVIGKGNKLAQAPLIGQLKDELVAWRGYYSEAFGALPLRQPVLISFNSIGGGCTGDERTYKPVWDAKGLGIRGIYNLVVDRCAEAGFDGVAPHDMRRTFAGMLQDQGMPVETIQAALRHDNLGTTSRYLSQDPRKMHDALAEVRF